MRNSDLRIEFGCSSLVSLKLQLITEREILFVLCFRGGLGWTDSNYEFLVLCSVQLA